MGQIAPHINYMTENLANNKQKENFNLQKVKYFFINFSSFWKKMKKS